MRLMLSIFAFACLPFRTHAQKGDSALLNYFVENGLLLTEQVAQTKQVEANIAELMEKEARKTANKDGREQLLRQARNVRLYGIALLGTEPNHDNTKDTLTTLIRYLTVSSHSPTMVVPGWHVSMNDPTDSIYRNSKEELHSFTEALNRSGIIQPVLAGHIHELIDRSRLSDSLLIVSSITPIRSRLWSHSEAHLRPLADKLLRLGVLNERGRDTVLHLSANGRIIRAQQIAALARNAVTLRIDTMSKEPDSFYRVMYQKLSMLAPELAFTNYQATKQRNPRVSWDTVGESAVWIKFETEGRRYSSCNSFVENPDPQHIVMEVGRLDANAHEVFNRVLADKGLDARIVLFTGFGDLLQPDDWTYLLLTQQQADSLQEDELFRVDPTAFAPIITTQAIDSAFKTFEQLGLFTHLKPSELDSTREAVRTRSFSDAAQLLFKIPRLVYLREFEGRVGKNVYRDITKEIAAYSRGHFRPTSIVDGYSWRTRKGFVYGFTLKGKAYRTQLSMPDDWIDLKFWKLIQQAMKEQDATGKFYPLPAESDLAIIYLTPQQYRKLKQANLFPERYAPEWER